MRIGPFQFFQKTPELEPLQGSQITETLRAGESLAAGGTAGVGATGKAEFSNLLERAVAGVDSKMQTAAAEQGKVLTGETNNLHQAMIAMQEASVAFSLMVEVRNKLVESYQELMRMQV